MIMARIYSLLIGYGLGNFITAYFVSLWRTGKSPHELGSGNPGTANIGAVLGKKFGILVLLGDLLKTLAAILICCWLFPELGRAAIMYAGIGATLGHNYPVWLHFKGGKGVAVSALLLVAYDWRWGLICLLIALAVLLVTKNLALPGIVILLSFTIVSAFLFGWEAAAGFGFLMLLSAFRFRHDLADLIHGRSKKVDLLQRFKRQPSAVTTSASKQTNAQSTAATTKSDQAATKPTDKK
ncbi:glycerol-3-phosphate acyltransferase [Lapidilactobacillus luobeiensis]|uniref:glycerol-3-phosphate acyltransferase n=1 Tax=Lapidilactobacillus luobeiensis TaxID=2950371 RepID=UPI0021C2D87E|nr:glycerol-3-phosphate acyltransferase [Lapidilactobacillus luobeiensis]